jgi:Rad9
MKETSPGAHILATISNENAKLLSAALYFLQKVGKELTIEAEAGVLTFRSLNDSKSPFISVEFENDFFDKYTPSTGADCFSCKVAIKVSTEQL